MFSKPVIVTSILLLLTGLALAQPASYNFRQLTTSDGLSDGIIRCIAQDKYGFVWLGTANGLTIYNGYTCRTIEADATHDVGFKDNQVMNLCKDKNETMWLAQPSGIYQYDYATGHFTVQPGTAGLLVTGMFAAEDGNLYIATRKGLKALNTQTKTWLSFATDSATVALLRQPIRDIAAGANDTLYLATDAGLITYKMRQRAALLPATTTSIKNLTLVTSDKKGRVWCSNGTALYRIENGNVTTYPQLTGAQQFTADNQINDLLADTSGRLWVAASRTGLCLYNEIEDRFNAFKNDPIQTQSLSTNLVTTLFQSSDGTLWIGTVGYGVNYFNPDKAFFHTLLPSLHQTPTLPDNWCRAVSQDRKGLWWLATATGVALYNPTNNNYQVLQNKEGGKKELQANSVRSILCAADGTVWIGTSDGLNRYHPQSGKMDFFGDKDGIPASFFWHMAEDQSHKIWIACRDGIYTYDPSTKSFTNNAKNKLLSTYCRFRTRSIFIDSRNRLWFGFDGNGVLLYDEKKQTATYWNAGQKSGTTISDNTIGCITEDKGGTIWISNNMGINAYDPASGNFKQYTKKDGLPSNIIFSLLADDQNRLWMGSNKGLCMFDSERRHVKSFGTEDGLTTYAFNEQAAYRMNNGLFIYPTLKGFLYFFPQAYKSSKRNAITYLSSFRVYNQNFIFPTNLEAVSNIDLKWDQSFFSFTVAAPDYSQAGHTMYAYRLEPFDKAWIYTKEREHNYTNVPGGNYILHIKATADLQDWNMPETTIRISIGTVFYKTWWFSIIVALLLISLSYAIYHYRLHQHRQLANLQVKATALEKEKTLALYQSLKQQLNPHFLFNSLSSLSSLIQKDQGAAKIFLDQLSKIYRYILKSGDSETVRISEDMKLAQIYVQLQQTRFGAGLQLHVQLNDEVLSRKIAPVTIQNLIENAIKHNIIDRETPLVISITADENYLFVQNNLQKKSFVEGSNKQGLQSMKTLYRYLCGQAVITEESPEYFTVKIPFV